MNKKMIVVAILMLVVSLFVTFKNIYAQAHVESKSFDLMLSTLLAHSVPEVGIADLPADSNLIYIDAREKAEYDVSHIENAIWVGYNNFDISRIDSINKLSNIIVYCSVGYRSEKITEKLKAAGFVNVSNLYGGIFEWVNTDLPVYDAQGSQTKKVHAYSKKWGVWLNKGVKVYE